MRRLALAGLATLLLGGCVYYNGMYNTKRLAGSARRAERDGRPFEATSLWGQVITRADSLVVRHPRSKYVEQALVYKGVALARLGQCSTAVGPLARASVLELEGEIAEEAALALGRCQMELGDPGAASLAFARVANSRDPALRREARVQSARALRLTGRPEEALAVLDSVVDPRGPEERLLSLAAADRRDEALALADTLLARNDSARVWDSVVNVVGRANPPMASALVDRLGSRPSATPALQARRLLDDANRLEATDSAAAGERLAQAARVGAGTDSGDRAELRLFRSRVSRAGSPAELPGLLDSLQRLSGERSTVLAEVQSLAATIAAVRLAVDSSSPDVPQGDLRLFLGAESARDTLRAPALAAALFRQLVETWPDSPYAPKALLAGQSLDPGWGEQARWLLDGRYWASPYVAFVRGEEPLGYRELEDSLQSYAIKLAAGQVRRRPPAGAAGRRTPEPGGLREDRLRPQRPDAPRRGLEQ